MKHKKIIVEMLILFLLIPACSSFAVKTGMRNPAAAYCVDLGYEYDIKKTLEGEHGICRFPDGSEANEWDFFAGQEKREFNYCTKNGLNTKTVSDERCAYNNKCAICVFNDGSEKEVTEYMKLKVFANGDEENNQINNDTAEEDTSLKSNYLLFSFILVLLIVFSLLLKKFIKKKN